MHQVFLWVVHERYIVCFHGPVCAMLAYTLAWAKGTLMSCFAHVVWIAYLRLNSSRW